MTTIHQIIPADTDSHLIECKAIDGTLYFAEVEPGLTLSQAVDLIASEAVTRPVSVLWFNPVEGWCRDVTEDAARELAAKTRDMGFLPRSSLEFVDRYAGTDVGDEIRHLEVA